MTLLFVSGAFAQPCDPQDSDSLRQEVVTLPELVLGPKRATPTTTRAGRTARP